jgi:hypothetical protein
MTGYQNNRKINMLSENDLYYMRAILGHLRELRKIAGGLNLGSEALADEIDWLDCYIDKHQRERDDELTRSSEG